MIVADFTIRVTSYKVEDVEKDLILAIWNNEPKLTIDQMAAELGISSRTLFRKINELELDVSLRRMNKSIAKKVSELESLGFIVTPK
jgi:DNA-binding NtrC family response regulator